MENIVLDILFFNMVCDIYLNLLNHLLLLLRLIYPLTMSYVDSAEFTFWGRLKSALIANAMFYGAGAVGVIIFFLVIFFTTANKEFGKAIGVGMVLANSWGLFLMVCFIGVGIIMVPKKFWRKSKVQTTLKQLQWKVGNLYDKQKETYDELVSTLKLVRKLDDEIRLTDRFRDFVDIIVNDCPPEYQLIEYGEGEIKYDRKGLVDLHYRLISAKYNHHCVSTELRKTIEKAIDLDDACNAKDQMTKFQVMWSNPKNSFIRRIPVIRSFVNLIEWLYWVYLVKWIWLSFSVIGYIATIILIWSEVTMFTAFLNSNSFPSLSIYYLLIWKVKSITPMGIQTIAFLSIIYNAWCTFKSLLNLKLFNWYELKKYKLSNTYSLFFSAAYLCRISVPVVLNMIYLAGFDNSNSAFIQVMGPMSVVPFFGGKFNIIFPALILLVSLLTLFSCWKSVLSCFKVKTFHFDEFYSDELIDKGRDIVNKEKESLKSGNKLEFIGDSFSRLEEGTSHNRDRKLFIKKNELDNDILMEDIVGPRQVKTQTNLFSSFFKRDNSTPSTPSTPKRDSKLSFQLSDSSDDEDDSFLYKKL